MGDETRNEGVWDEIYINRNYMKCPEFNETMATSDQAKKLPQPPLNIAAAGEVILLSADFGNAVTRGAYADLLDARRSERVFDGKKPLSREQLAFLLWSSQGVQEIRGSNYAALRPVPSGGARHPFEVYFYARLVDGLAAGIYHYLPLEHIGEKKAAVEYCGEFPNGKGYLQDMLADQKWASAASAVFFVSCVAYRAEWRYGVMAHRVALIDLGHVGQNLMLSATATGLGSCCIAAYDQKMCDGALGLDGVEEYTVYACAVGHPKRG